MPQIPTELHGPILYLICSGVIVLLCYLVKRAFEDLLGAVRTLTQQMGDLGKILVRLETRHEALDRRVTALEEKVH